MQETQETRVQSLSQEDPLEEGMAPTPVFILGESPWTGEPCELQSMESQRVGHDSAYVANLGMSQYKGL